MEPETFRYFAYGSNMLTRRLTAQDRAPSAKRFGTGYVKGRRLRFDKASKDGSGKCDAELTGVDTDRVYGVLFDIEVGEKSSLDKAEGLGHGYEEQTLDIETGTSIVKATIYVATKKERVLRPYHWYKALTIAGAVEHGLPIDYVEWLRVFEAIEDLDAERCSKNEALLFVS